MQNIPRSVLLKSSAGGWDRVFLDQLTSDMRLLNDALSSRSGDGLKPNQKKKLREHLQNTGKWQSPLLGTKAKTLLGIP